MEATSTAEESRVAELLKANAALKATLESLAKGADIDAVLGNTLRAISEQLAGPGCEGSLWLAEQDGRYHRVHLVLQGGVILSPEAALHPSAGILSPLDQDDEFYEKHYVQGRPSILRVESIAVPAWAEYLRRRGVRAVLTTPMLLGGRPLGSYVLRIPEGVPDPSPERIELALALAQQATFALHMTRLAKDAELAAIERERASAAEARAAKLAAANRLLRESAEKLGNIHDIDEYLGQVLLTITELLGGHSSTIWTTNHEKGESKLRYVVQEGRAIPGEFSDHPNARTPFKTPPGADLLMPGHGTGNAQPYQRRIDDNLGFDERTRAHFAALGVTSLVSVPVVLNNRHFGTLTIRLTEDRHLLDDEREMIQALAGQAAVALHLTQLAEQAREAAVSREKEEAANQRAEILARANAAVRSSLDRLAERQDLSAFLGETLVVCASELDAVGAGIWMNDDEGYTSLAVSFEDGEVRHLETIKNPAARKSYPQNIGTLNRGGIVIQSKEDILRDFPFFQDYLETRKVIAVSHVPLFVGERWMGQIALRHTREPQYTQEKRELAHALANQVALALELTRLADEARQAAIAREREEAANRRAEVLARANAAIRSSLDRLAERQDLNAFLGEAIQVCARELNAVGAGIWVREHGLNSLIVSFEDGEVRYLDRIEHPGVLRQSSHSDVQDFRRGEILIQAEEELRSQAWYPVFREYLESRGVVALVRVPMFIGERWAGTIVLRFTETPAFPPEQRELAHALANQVALALELTRLAEEAQQAAIVREQEEAANRRAEVLARANAAIRSSLDRLAERQDLNAFLGEAIQVCARELNAVGAGIWEREDGVNSLIVSLEDGEVRYVDGIKHPGVRGPRNDHDQELSRGGITIQNEAEIRSQPWWPSFREYLEARGIVAIASVPLFIGERWAGTIVLRFTETPAFPPEQRELAHALANQVALALELTRLAEEAQEAAIVREQEKSARERADELSRMNQIIRSTVEVMTSIPALDEFLGAVMAAINESLGARGSTLWILDYEALKGRLAMCVVGGSWSRTPPVYEGSTLLAEFPFDDTAAAYFANLTPRFTPNIQDHPNVDAGTRKWLQILKVAGLQEVPIAVGGKVIASMSIHCLENEPFPSDKLELAIVLSQQVGLAIHLTHLAEEAQKTAIALEKQHAAQQQSAQLAKANQALSYNLTKLASHSDVEGFLGEVLLTICQQLGEADGGVWLYDYSFERLTLRLSLEEGKLLKGEWPEARWIIPGKPNDGSTTLERERLRNMVAVYTMEDVRTLPEWQPYREILTIQGFRSLMEIPMYIGEQIIGFYAIRARDHESFDSLEIELSQALANQAALACHMARLGEAATHAAQLAAVAEERNRLAREIHDTLAQGLAAIAMQLQGATRERASLPRAIRPYLETAFEIARESLAEARRSVNTLRSPGSTKGGFAASVTRIVEQAQRTSVAKIDLRIDSRPFTLPRKVEDESLRVLQESLTNSAKHSRASEILVELFSAEQGGIRLKVKDNGTGFDADQPTAGFGLAIMQERAEGIGATLTLITEPGEGTEVVLVWTANE